MLTPTPPAQVQTQVQIKPNTTKTSIFYINDEHSQIENMQRLKTAADEFSTSSPSEKADKLKFSSGDFGSGPNVALNTLAVEAQNAMGIMAAAGGNHEFDLPKKDLVEVLKNNNYKILGLNVEIPETSAENKQLKKEISKSYIQEQNGSKYGIIGLFPTDFFFHVTNPKEYEDFKILSSKETIDATQKEVDALKAQGINKIIVLSHAGYCADKELAQSVEGIDVILGGHSHDLIKGIKEGENLFYSKKTGEPTIITQAGKDGKYFGILNLEFNKNGIITKAQNNINKTQDFPKSSVMGYLTDIILGKPKVIGSIASVPKYSFSLISENPNANFINDASKSELGVDIIITNPGGVRANFTKGNITDRDLSTMFPFKNNMAIFKLTEKELVDAIKYCAKTIPLENHEPGLLQFSGIRYTVSKSGEVKNINFVDKDGKEKPIDINNPNPFKTYRVAGNSYIAKGGNNFIPNKWDCAEVTFDFDQSKLVTDYLKKSTKPIDIKTDGRIKVED